MALSAEEKRLDKIEKQGAAEVKKSDSMYDTMINQSGTFYSDIQKAVESHGTTQQQLLDEQSQFTIDKVEQEKEKTEKDYQKEAGAAYVDWQKQKDEYGVNAERMAQSGLAGSGFSESSQVQMYAAYQQRVATARESAQNAITSYNNAITEARLQNSSAKAELAFNTLLTSLQYALEGFNVGNDLLVQKQTAGSQISDTYYGRYRDEVNQINTEKALAEEIRQYNASLAEERRQFNENLKKKNNVSSSGSKQIVEVIGDTEERKIKDDAQKQRIYQSVGMARTTEGRLTAIEKLLNDGTISEIEAEEMLENFGLKG